MDLRDAYFVDGVRTWFGKARQDGFYFNTRADDHGYKDHERACEKKPYCSMGRSG